MLQMLHLHKMNIDKSARQFLNGHPTKVIWFTGILGSGKSTIAHLFPTAASPDIMLQEVCHASEL